MAESKAHRSEVFWIEAIQKRAQLATNATKEVESVYVGDHFYSQFFTDRACWKRKMSLHGTRRNYRRRTKLRVYHNQRFLVLALFHDGLAQELLQTLSKFPFLHRGDFLNCDCRRRESVHRLQF